MTLNLESSLSRVFLVSICASWLQDIAKHAVILAISFASLRRRRDVQLMKAGPDRTGPGGMRATDEE